MVVPATAGERIAAGINLVIRGSDTQTSLYYDGYRVVRWSGPLIRKTSMSMSRRSRRVGRHRSGATTTIPAPRRAGIELVDARTRVAHQVSPEELRAGRKRGTSRRSVASGSWRRA